MNRSIDKRPSSGDLPNFLADEEQVRDDVVNESEQADLEDEDYDEEDGDDLDDEQDFDDAEGDDEELDDDGDDDGDGDDDDDYEARSRTERPVRRRRYEPTLTPAGGGGAFGLGLLLTITGAVFTFVPAASAVLAQTGVDPQIVAVIGVAVLALGCSQRRVGRMQQRLEQYENQRNGRDEEVRDALAELLQRAPGNAETPAPADGGELQHMLLSLQRLDQKINNLTKAIKMYGKPLMEIAGQGTELAGSVAQVKTLVEGGAETTRQAVTRLEQQVRSSSGKADLGELPGQVGKLEVAIAAIGQRLDDSEVRKSLVRLEDASEALQGAVDELHKGDATRALGDQIQQGLDKATKMLATGIEQLRDGNVAGIETSVKDIQREVSGLATSLAQIQAAVKSGARVAAPAPSQPAPAQKAPAPQPNGAAAKPAQPSAGGDAESGDGYSTGKRKTGGKNVLGAIAKLKQMKG
ncbi:MAG: hypothetical protein KAI24_20170 [Planctomycetes bacterium]|nr:hypothetical protein [Planctomycetota bacterium]